MKRPHSVCGWCNKGTYTNIHPQCLAQADKWLREFYSDATAQPITV